MIADFPERLIAELGKAADELGAWLADGKADDIETYRRLAGERRGLVLAMDLAKSLMKSKDEDEDEE